MRILVTNDDGVFAPGLLALSQEMRKIGQVDILAPDRNWSGGGHVKTLDRPLRVKEVQLADGTKSLASDGAPSDCVALSLLGYLPEKADIVVSGINPTANLSQDVTYSGTVTAAMEAVIWGVPAIAFSLDSSKHHLELADFSEAAMVATVIVKKVQSHGLPAGVLLNVNIPDIPKEMIKGFRLTRQGMRVYHDRIDQRIDPRGQPYYWIGGEAPTGIPENGSDFGALSEGYVSITPLQLDLTAYPALHLLRNWDWNSLRSKPGSNGQKHGRENSDKSLELRKIFKSPN
jgi:5'-nucleotidase